MPAVAIFTPDELAEPTPLEDAREALAWRPVAERDAFIDGAIRVHAPKP